MKKKISIPILVFFIIMLNTLLLVVSGNLPSIIGSFKYLWGPLAFIVIFIYKPTSLLITPLKFIWLYGLITLFFFQMFIWTNIDEWNRKALFEEFYNIAIFAVIFNYFKIKHDYKGLATIAKWSLFFIVISLITTNIALSIDPLIVRNSASGFLDDVKQFSLAKRMGAAGYGYVQAIILLIPVMVYYIKNKRDIIYSRWVFIFILILIIITTLRSNVFANLLILLVITPLSFMGFQRRQLVTRYLILLFGLYILIPNIFLSDFFSNLATFFDNNSEMYNKLTDFSYFIKNPEMHETTDTGGRVVRYPLLFEAFVTNPFLGYSSQTNTINISEGGHLYWMNKLAQFGMIFFIFFVFLLYNLYVSIIKVFIDREVLFYYSLSIVAFIFMGLTKNVSGREIWAFLIIVIPGLFLLPFLSKNFNSVKLTDDKSIKFKN